MKLLYKKEKVGKNLGMNRKEYVFALANLIKNRVRYHAPFCLKEDVDFEKISRSGIDLSKPIFIFEKKLKKGMYKAFSLAKKQANFNLFLKQKSRLLKLKDTFLIDEKWDFNLESLDINYKTNSQYFSVEKGNYLKIFEKIENFEQNEFFQESKNTFESIYLKTRRFLLNGENLLVEMINTGACEKVVEVEFNKDLGRGYFSFMKTKSGVSISNLFKDQKLFFNCNFGKHDLDFSCIDGVEHSSFARINMKAKVLLKPFRKKSFFINIGSSCFNLTNKSEMEYFFSLAKQKHFEIFDVKISSENKFFERNFNEILPFKIWNKWILGERDCEVENEYLSYKNSIVLKDKKRFFLQKNDFGINDVFVYQNKNFKKLDLSH